MTKTPRESFDLPEYASQQTSLLHPTNDVSNDEIVSRNTTVEHYDGLVRVDAILHPYVVASDTETKSRDPVTLTSFLIGYDPNFHNILDVVREHLEASKLVDFDKYEYNGIRLPDKGPVLGHAAWAQMGSDIHHVEAIIDLPMSEKLRLHRNYRYKTWACRIGIPTSIIGICLSLYLLYRATSGENVP